ncbi:hypothetical protein QQF64_010786 [Cirrhinus molitorella]|uniref:ADF-H domain-containing protein n=3 Tax=Labeonini TaxID=2743697 RepID=A0ABR3LXC5_9TELE
MASGVTVSDEVIKVFNDMKVRKSSTSDEVKKRKKAVLFCLSDDKKKIVVEEGNQILVGDIGDTVDDPYACFVKLLPLNDCRYGLYDATYETKESKKEDLVFIFWAPEGAPLKSKMIYASSKDAIKKKFTGIKHEWQVNGLDDIQDRSTLAEKLGGSVVVSLEGRPLPAGFYERGLAVDLGLRPVAAFPFGEFDPQAGSNPLLLGAIYGQHAFVSCHRCPQMAKLNMLPKSYKRDAGGRAGQRL